MFPPSRTVEIAYIGGATKADVTRGLLAPVALLISRGPGTLRSGYDALFQSVAPQIFDSGEQLCIAEAFDSGLISEAERTENL